MRVRVPIIMGLVLALVGGVSPVLAKEVVPMYGGVLTEGYDFGKDLGPKGSVAYDPDRNEFVGYYNGLKMPKGRRAIFAWLHDTVNQRTEYLGPVGALKLGTGGKNKGQFRIKVPEKYRGGRFGSNEIIGFTAEKSEYIDGDRVVTVPSEPSGSARQPQQKPAFYLFAALPGADTTLSYCGHGQDFFYAKAPEKQFCYD